MCPQCPGDTVQTVTGKIDPARKFKCTMAARELVLISVNFFNFVCSINPQAIFTGKQ